MSRSCAVLEGGGLRCWGSGSFGGLGYGNSESIGDIESPAAAGDVPVGFAVTQVETNGAQQFTCAKSDYGAVRCWGINEDAQLGYTHTLPIGMTETPAAAAQPGGIGGDLVLNRPALALVSGARCALLDNLALRCWGANDSGQLGKPEFFPNGSLGRTPAAVGPITWE